MTTPSKKLRVPARYKDTSKHFQGGFGEVRILHDEFLDRRVALKTIQNATDADQLRNEVLAISEIRSKNVVEIYDLVFNSEGTLEGIIEEYLSGEDLTDFAQKARYDQKKYLIAIFQIASGIADIHGQGLVHRDIKLNNLKKDSEGIIKLFDFGLSCIDSDHKTPGGRGTRMYAAPELYSPPLVIERSLDTYAFGVCCWALGTAKIPSQLTEIPPQKSGRVPSILAIDKNLPADLVRTLDLTLDPSPAGRPPMSEVRDVIGKHLLFGRHRAWLTGGHQLSAPGQSVTVGSNVIGKITITYDGIGFYVSAVSGDVFINNRALAVGEELPGSCVITIGSDSLGAMRSFVAFNVSHPEIVL